MTGCRACAYPSSPIFGTWLTDYSRARLFVKMGLFEKGPHAGWDTGRKIEALCDARDDPVVSQASGEEGGIRNTPYYKGLQLAPAFRVSGVKRRVTAPSLLKRFFENGLSRSVGKEI